MTLAVRHYIKKSLMVFGLLLMAGGQAYGIGGMDTSLCRVPAFLQQSVSLDPNVLVLIDSSGSMNWEAYLDHRKDVGGANQLGLGESYYGIFEADQCYIYDYTNDWFTSVGMTRTDFSCDQTVLPGTFSGTFLNLASGTRLEIVKKVFTGGIWYNGFSWGDPAGHFRYGCYYGAYNIDVPAEFLPGGQGQRVSNVMRYTGNGSCWSYYTPNFYSSFNVNGAGLLRLRFYEAGGMVCGPQTTVANGVRQGTCGGTESNCVNSSTATDCASCNPAITPPGDSCSVSGGGSTAQCTRTRNGRCVWCDVAGGSGGNGCRKKVNGVKCRKVGCGAPIPSGYDTCLNNCRSGRVVGGGTVATCNYSPAICDCTTTTWACVPSTGQIRDYFYRLRVKQAADPWNGLLQEAYTKARWSLFTFDLIGNSGGRMAVPMGGSLNALVSEMRTVVARTGTPLAEALYTSILYYRQNERSPYHPGAGGDFPLDPNGPLDPLYENSSGKAVGCRELNILALTDGEPTGDGAGIPNAVANADGDGIGANASYNTVRSWWPPAKYPAWLPGNWGSYWGDWYDDVAFWGHTQDMRADLAGPQNINIYSVYAFGTGDYARFLMWEAGKNGKFKDLNGNGKPDRSNPAEWDQDGDGDPDGFFLAENGDQLKNKLQQAFSKILERSSSVAPISYLGAAGTGQGIATQSFFNPKFTSAPGLDTTWAGFLRSFWLDSGGLLRADTDPGTSGSPQLNISTDQVIEFRYIPAQEKTVVDYYGPIDPNNIPLKPWTGLYKGTSDIDQIPSVYDFGKSLAKQSPASRRLYTDLAGTKTNFVASKAASLQGPLGATSVATAAQIIDYIRGQDQPGLRSRTVIDPALGPLTWKLGDSTYSKAIFLGSPPDPYSYIPEWASLPAWKKIRSEYADFVTAHADDPLVMAIGANDGMVHAFAMGKVRGGADSLLLGNDPGIPLGSDGTALKRGDEVWGWIPSPALIHLNWLTEDAYCHVYYVDGNLKTFYLNAFTPDAAHPLGWGRMLAVTLRTGCPAYKTSRPGWLFLDVTDPYNPGYMGFFTERDVGTAYWEPVVTNYIDPSGKLRHHLVLFGGPDDDLDIRRTTQNYMYVLDVPLEGAGTLGATFQKRSLPPPFDKMVFVGGAVGDISSAGMGTLIAEGNWPNSGNPVGRDLISDMIYAGGYVETAGGFDGHVMAVDLKGGRGQPYEMNPMLWRLRPLLRLPGMPVQSLAFPYLSPVFYVGTGRSETMNDFGNTTQQAVVLVADPCFSGESGSSSTINCANFSIPNISQFVDQTAFVINKALSKTDCAGTFAPCTDTGIRTAVLQNFGAKFLFSGAGERVDRNGNTLRGFLFLSTFSPKSTGACSFGGTSNLYVLKMFPDGETPVGVYENIQNIGIGQTTVGAMVNGRLLIQNAVGEVKVLNVVPQFSGPYFGYGPFNLKERQ